MDLSLLFANTFLLRIPALGPLARFGHLHAKPAVQARTVEYATVLPEYDVCALAEVFRPDDLASMIGAWPSGSRPDVAVGPTVRSSFGTASSGLVTLSSGPRIVRAVTHVFTDQGSRWRDSDAWSAKGVLLTEIEVEGHEHNLEVLNTHLIAGGDVANTVKHRSRTEAVRFGQIGELLAVVEQHHRPANPMVVVGDFNVQADTPSGDRLNAVMADAGFTDLWVEHGVGAGPTCDAMVLREAIAATDPDDRRFCVDPPPGHPDAERIDYAFVGGNADAVAVSDVRRRVFPRDVHAVEYDVMPYLSDHVALHLELTV